MFHKDKSAVLGRQERPATRLFGMFQGLLVLASLGSSSAAQAQALNYPARPIRLIVPFEPGGSTDITARIVASAMSDRFKKGIIVENRAGAGGNLGTDLVAKAAPDGYTLLWANVAPIAINPYLYTKVSYDVERDFAPITLSTVFPNVLVAKPNLNVESFASFAAKARSENSGLFYGSAGNGSSTHLGAAWLSMLLGAHWKHIPYKGGAPALLAVASGEIDLYLSSVPAALPYVSSGALKALATTGKTRDPALPDVPTVAEAGYPEYDVVNWNGLLAPKGTPEEIIDYLNKTVVELLSSPDLKAKLVQLGAFPSPMSRGEFSDFIKAESKKWSALVTELKVKVE
jgi:tripartite-type tricarboxylate transporter receptor subunit TctC